MRVLVYGATGWIGRRFHLDGKRWVDICIAGREDILDSDRVRKEVAIRCPDVVVNCAGICGSPNIDWCEMNPQNRRLTMAVNAYGPRVLLDAVRQESDAMFVHLSSGCLWNVADDAPPLDETAEPMPPSLYSKSKAEGEDRLKGIPGVLIVRLRMPIDWIPHERNLIDKLRKYSSVIDVPNSVTTIHTLVTSTFQLIYRRESGIYHVVDFTTSAAELMRLYKEEVDPSHEFEVISLDELFSRGLVSSGRSNCRLSIDKLCRVLGRRQMTESQSEEALRDLMKMYRENM